MRMFLFSKHGDAVCLAIKATEIGHEAAVLIKDPEAKEIGNGLVQKVSDWKTEAKKADFILFDHVGFGNLAEDLRKEGRIVLGACRLGDALELNRVFGITTMRVVGIPVPSTSPQLKTLAQAEKWVSEHKKRGYVYKPLGAQEAGTTYVSEGTDDLLGMIPVLQKRVENTPFIIQERIEDGVEISHEGWFNGKVFCQSNITFEEKKFGEGNRGRTVGCMGNVVFNLHKNTPLHQKTLKKMIPILRKGNFRGPIDLNMIVTKDQIYGLEFTPRLGYDAIQALLEGFQEDWVNWFWHIGNGATRTPRTTSETLIAVRLATNPYPEAVTPKNTPKDVPIFGITKENLRHIWLSDIKKTEDNFVCAGADGAVLVITARGSTIREARSRAYRTIDGLTVPNKTYRRDIGERAHNDFEKLRKWGYL